MIDIAEKLIKSVRSQVYAKQVHKVHSLKDKYIERDGILFLVLSVDWKNGYLIASDTKTPLRQTTKFSIKSFLSKSVQIVEGE